MSQDFSHIGSSGFSELSPLVISAHKGMAGWRDDYWRYDVYVNGVKMKDVFWASALTGRALQYIVNDRREFLVNELTDEVQARELKGDVEIRLRDGAGQVVTLQDYALQNLVGKHGA